MKGILTALVAFFLMGCGGSVTKSGFSLNSPQQNSVGSSSFLSMNANNSPSALGNSISGTGASQQGSLPSQAGQGSQTVAAQSPEEFIRSLLGRLASTSSAESIPSSLVSPLDTNYPWIVRAVTITGERSWLVRDFESVRINKVSMTPFQFFTNEVEQISWKMHRSYTSSQSSAYSGAVLIRHQVTKTSNCANGSVGKYILKGKQLIEIDSIRNGVIRTKSSDIVIDSTETVGCGNSTVVEYSHGYSVERRSVSLERLLRNFGNHEDSNLISFNVGDGDKLLFRFSSFTDAVDVNSIQSKVFTRLAGKRFVPVNYETQRIHFSSDGQSAEVKVSELALEEKARTLKWQASLRGQTLSDATARSQAMSSIVTNNPANALKFGQFDVKILFHQLSDQICAVQIKLLQRGMNAYQRATENYKARPVLNENSGSTLTVANSGQQSYRFEIRYQISDHSYRRAGNYSTMSSVDDYFNNFQLTQSEFDQAIFEQLLSRYSHIRSMVSLYTYHNPLQLVEPRYSPYGQESWEGSPKALFNHKMLTCDSLL